MTERKGRALRETRTFQGRCLTVPIRSSQPNTRVELNSWTFIHAIWCCKRNVNPLKPELNPICYLLALLGAHHFLHVSRIRVKSRGTACLVWDYLTPTLTQTHFTIPPAPLRKKWPQFYCGGHDDSKWPVASVFRYKNNSSPKTKAAGFFDTLVNDYHTRCRT